MLLMGISSAGTDRPTDTRDLFGYRLGEPFVRQSASTWTVSAQANQTTNAQYFESTLGSSPAWHATNESYRQHTEEINTEATASTSNATCLTRALPACGWICMQVSSQDALTKKERHPELLDGPALLVSDDVATWSCSLCVDERACELERHKCASTTHPDLSLHVNQEGDTVDAI